MLTIRQKLSIGFGGLLAVLVIVGTQAIYLISDLGQSIDVILRENYRSVIACQDMKEALERMDSGALFCLLGYEEGRTLIDANELIFQKALDFELNNITVPGEKEKAEHIRDLYAQYQAVLHEMHNPTISHESRTAIYFKKQLPLFYQTKDAADAVLHVNQQNMSEANDHARERAASARQQMGFLLFAGAVLSISCIVLIRRWILHPISRLIESADEIKKGNLDLCVQASAHDEIGRLSEAFNDMARSLREFRRSEQAKLDRLQRSAQQTFSSLPEAVVVIDMDGTIEVATDAARSVFNLSPGTAIKDGAHLRLRELYDRALKRPSGAEGRDEPGVFQFFVHGEEHFFQPKAVPILDAQRLPTGVVLSIRDVTQQREHDDMKRGLVSTVSHQLKTPLTSIRMAVHLLLEENVGALTEKQAELLLAAREDSDRLNGILDDLLDISRIESGKVPMSFAHVSPQAIAAEAAEHFAAAFQDNGISLQTAVPGNLPEVIADAARMVHVFDNLLSNALKHTPAGGSVTMSARADEEKIIFSVSDTGAGIPREYLNNIFDQFFRVPGQQARAGAGLGLAIAREIVEAHGGSITVESTEGHGSTFTVMLKKAAPVRKE